MVFKKLFWKIYKAITTAQAKLGAEYWVPLSQIYVPEDYRKTCIGRVKYANKVKFYDVHGYCESKIVLNRDFMLIDGYSSYVILRNKEGRNAFVPVYFVD